MYDIAISCLLLFKLCIFNWAKVKPRQICIARVRQEKITGATVQIENPKNIAHMQVV